MTNEDREQRDLDAGPRAFARWLNDNKGAIGIGVVSAVVSDAISDAFGGILAWLVRVSVVAATVVFVGVIAARRFGGSRDSGPPTATAEKSDAGGVRSDQQETRGPSRSWMTVGATALLVLWALGVATGGRESDRAQTSPRPSSSDVPTPPPTDEPEAPVSYIGESLEVARGELASRGVDIRFEARRDPSAAGTILEQDPEPLDSDADVVAFVVAARPQAIEIDEGFLAEENTAWRQGPQSVFGYPHEHTFFVRDADCIKYGGYECEYRRRSPLLAIALKRQFEVFSAVIGFEHQSGPSNKSLVEVVTYGIGNDEDGETICIAEVGPTLPPLRLRADVSGQLRLEILYRPWRGRQIPVVASPEGIAVDVGLMSPPVTGLKNLLPVPPSNPRCYG
ncbi:MAG: hypothetical protein M3134_06350 [Actinomycetota bacterium]|nr:hypothetical protein [Actinomycetota bacterium]